MSTILTETPTFDADVTVPDGGDARIASSVRGAFQKLTNRTAHLKDTPEITGEYRYDGAKTRTQLLNLALGATFNADGTPGWKLTHLGGSPLRWASISDLGCVRFPIDLPHGATLTQVRAIVNPGDAGSGNVVMTLKKNSGADFGAATPPSTSTLETVSSSGTAAQTLTMTVSPTVVAGNDAETYYLDVFANNDGETASDLLTAIEITYDELGPGDW